MTVKIGQPGFLASSRTCNYFHSSRMHNPPTHSNASSGSLDDSLFTSQNLNSSPVPLSCRQENGSEGVSCLNAVGHLG